MLCCNILKISSVLPQQDGPDTAIKSQLLVEKKLFIALGLEVRSKLFKIGAKIKMLTPCSPIEKKQLDKRYCNRKDCNENLSKINNF